jgi:2-polyprenyl-3-methyl-5-hydroxy-6-metoxy-1,4-benzoquinol methylase
VLRRQSKHMELVPAAPALTPRQRRELEYHRQRAAELRAIKLDEPVSLAVVQQPARRWWNAYWETYHLALEANLAGKRVVVPGCGFGEDAIRLAAIGAEVHAFDLSSESVEIARQRAETMSLNIVFDSVPAEQTAYQDRFFDAVWFLDTLHHVDIPATLAEMRRILKPGALIIANELYTHSSLDRIRKSRFVAGWLYSRMQRFIYGEERPYITEDEHKIDEREFAQITENFKITEKLYFNFLVGRILPQRFHLVAKADRILIRFLGPIGHFLAGRIVFVGLLKDA